MTCFIFIFSCQLISISIFQIFKLFLILRKHVNIIDWYCNKYLVFCVILSCHCVNKIVDINQIMMSPCLVSRSATTKKKPKKTPPKIWMEIKLQTTILSLSVVNLLSINYILFRSCSSSFFLNYSDINNWIKFQIVSLCNNDAYPTCNKYHLSFLRFCFIKIKKNKNFFLFFF